MPGFRLHKVTPPDIPLRSPVRDAATGRIGVLIAWGTRSARVKFDARAKGSKFVKLRNLQAVTQEELDAALKAEGWDLV